MHQICVLLRYQATPLAMFAAEDLCRATVATFEEVHAGIYESLHVPSIEEEAKSCHGSLQNMPAEPAT